MKKIIIVITILMISGCVSPYSKFYTDNTGGDDITKDKKYIITNNEPEVRQGTDPINDQLLMLENGYFMIGSSVFNAGNVSEEGAISKAKEIHASVVLLCSRYSETESGYTPLTLPNTSTSSTTANGNIYGQGGSVSYNGTSNTTYNGTKTTYIPFSVKKYDYAASYWVKRKPPIFGVIPTPLDQEVHKKIGTNKGMLVAVVIKGSPAFYADIFKNDILLNINDDVIFDNDSFTKSINKNADKNVDVIIIRDDKELHKMIKFGQLQN